MDTIDKVKNKKGLSRRKFLIRGGFVLGGTVVAVYLGRSPLRRMIAGFVAEMDLPSGVSNFAPAVWFEVMEDNTILMKSPKVEMGQGVFTGYAMLAAEELEVPLHQITVVPGASNNSAEDMIGTGGSSSTGSMYISIREVAATMREMLKMAAAKIWQLSIEDVTVEDGQVLANNQTMTYAEVVRKTTEWEIPETPPLKPKSAFKYVGKDVKRVDLKPKVMGDAIFAMDVELPNMVYAVTLECPYIGGMLKSVDTSEAKQFPGVLQILEQDGLVAVVAKNRYAAEMGKRRLKAEWDVPKVWQQADIDALLTIENSNPVNIQKEGGVNTIFKDSPEDIIQFEYRTPIGVHAQMEPNGAVAQVDDDKALVIVGTQDTYRLLGKISDAVGLPKEKIELRNSFLGGGFGRRFLKHKAVDAARIAKITGKPVHVFRDREEEFMNGYFRPPAYHVMKAKITDEKIEAIEHLIAVDSMMSDALPPIADKILGADFISSGHGAKIEYQVPNRSTTMYEINMPFPVGIWRGVGTFLSAFPIESFMDELAHNMGKDPIALRLEYINDETPDLKRLKTVIETARDSSGWSAPKPDGTGRGFACFIDRKTIVAAVVIVKVTDGHIKVVQVTHVTDPGLIVNPEGVRTQVEGCVMMGLSATLYEETTVEDGKFVATNYHQYPMAMLSDTPEIEVVLLEGADRPYGIGEPPIVPIAPAIANAVFDLTGQRLRSLPLKLEK